MTAPQAPDSAPTTVSQKGASATTEPPETSSRGSLGADQVTTRQAAVPADRVRRPGPPRPTTEPPETSSRGSIGADQVTTRQAAVPADRVRRPGPPRPTSSRTATDRPGAAKAAAGRTRKARLALKRIDPWSVFLFSLIASVFMGIALVVAVAVLFTILSGLGVVTSINDLVAEINPGAPELLTMSRLLTISSILAAVNVVLLTLLATLGALLYNACASFTGGIELTLGERD